MNVSAAKAHAIGSPRRAAGRLGAQTEGQLAQLCRIGCAFAQGFCLARPLPADRIGALLAARARGIVSVRDARPAGRADAAAGEGSAA